MSYGYRYGARVADEAQYLVVARKPGGWMVPDTADRTSHERWKGLNQELKSLRNMDVAGVICRSERAAKTVAARCHNLGLEADYVKLEDVLQ